MNVAQSMCASSGKTTHANQSDWLKSARPVSGLQVHIVEVSREFPALPGPVRTGLRNGLSRMRGNFHVRFSGEGAAAMPLPYPTRIIDVLNRLHIRMNIMLVIHNV
jgi:hypothetical protein